MEFERIEPNTSEWEKYYGNHISRYHFAKKIIEEYESKKILDIACGVGYGSKYLSNIKNSFIVGADRSLNALNIANTCYKAENIDFVFDDCQVFETIGSYSTFDSIVSFETLEHLTNPDVFLNKCLEFLKKDGQLIISTPNSFITSPTGKVTWKFHEVEYTPEQFYNLLQNAGFKNIQLFGQELNPQGVLRQEIANYINIINSNPTVKLGRWIQKVIRGHKNVSYQMLEKSSDYHFTKFLNLLETDNLIKNNPFVLIAVAIK